MGALIIMLILLGVIYHAAHSVSSGSSSNNSPSPRPAPEAKQYDTDFFNLCLSGTAEAVQSAIPSWKNAHQRDDGGNKTNFRLNLALIAAATNNADERVCKVIIDAGADVKSKTVPDGQTALHCAIANSRRNPKILDALISAGSDVNARDNEGVTPLMVAALAQFDNSRIIKALINAGADVNARDNDGVTPLMTAAARAQSDNCMNIKTLINAGADIEATHTIEDGTGSSTGNALSYAMTSGNAQNVRALIEAGVDVNKQWESKDIQNGRFVDIYQYPLHEAVGFGNIEILKLLLDAGAYVNARDSWGKTPLYHAQMEGNIEAARILQARGGTL